MKKNKKVKHTEKIENVGQVEETEKEKQAEGPEKITKTEITKQITEKTISKKDIIAILIITVIYAILSFYNLGNLKNPQTFWICNETNPNATLQLETSTYVDKIRYYIGDKTDYYYVYTSKDGKEYEKYFQISPKDVFEWEDIQIKREVEYIAIASSGAGSFLGEVAALDKDGNIINLTPMDENAKLIVDEQNTVPNEVSYLNSTYFDETYFPRTAYEYLHNMSIYEWTHPPLGKLIMTVPILIFGMTPFAYRVLGNIAGILMIAVIYIFAKTLFGKTKYGVLAGIIMAVDGMHFVQTRIGTVDSFLVLFIMLEYLFMYKYIISNGQPLKKRLWLLFWSGLFMGLAIAIKWIGVFAAIGLAVIFSASVIIDLVKKKKKWTKDYTVIFLCCIVFFVIIPLLMYLISYLPSYNVNESFIENFKNFIELQQNMYNYHHDLVATHPYSSPWYTWPATAKNILYWAGSTHDGKITRIALLGNPAIFWFSIPCILSLFLGKPNYKNWFLVIAIVAMIVPYIFINRIMFLYHYFPILPFAMLSIVSFMKWLCEKIKNDIPIYIFLAVAVVVFFIFYPIYSGFPTTMEYLEKLKWLKGWVW